MRRSSLMQLPEDLRRELNARLVSNGFGDYDGLAEWLDAELEKRDLEISISRSAIHRHGQKFEDKLEKLRIATEHAKAISEGSEDDEGAMNEALIRLVQQQAFDVLLDLNDEEKPANLPKLGVMIARLSRASVNQKKWKREVQEQLEKEKQRVAGEVESLVQDSGLSDERVALINAKILGVKLDV